jgi:hypothetical protein
MSQSDYIQYLKVSTELQSIKKLSPILDSGDYTDYIGYSIENKIPNTKQVNSQLTLPNQKIIYDIATIDVSGCPVFLTCNNTNTRANRILHHYSGYCNPLRPLTQKQRGVSLKKLNLCLCNFTPSSN